MDYRPAMRTRTGIGRYVAGLSRALAANGCDLRLYGVFFRGNRPERREAPPGARLVSWKVPARLVNWLYLMRVCNMDGIVGGCSVFHHTDFQIPERPLRAREVLSVHDLTFMRMADSHSQRARRAQTRVVYTAARRCDAFLCPSEASAQDCAEHLGVGEERTFVVPHGVDRHFFSIPARDAERSRPPYLLALGTIEPRKNVPRIVAAFNRIAERHPGLELVIAGRWGWLYEDVEQAVRASPVRARIKLPGFVPERQLGPLLRDAEMLLYPSLMEGFGLPILEGMAAGRPVLTSDREPLRSVAGGAARLVDPEDVESIADGMQQLLCDEELRSDLIRRGREHARRFSWEACAAQTQRVYEAVAR